MVEKEVLTWRADSPPDLVNAEVASLAHQPSEKLHPKALHPHQEKLYSDEANQTVQLDSGDILLKPNSNEVIINGQIVSLTSREFEILSHLAQTPGKVVDYMSLVQIMGYSDFSKAKNVIKTHIKSLRRKTEPLHPDLILNKQEVGYFLNIEDPSPSFISFGSLTLNLNKQVAIIDCQEISLTPTELKLLEYLILHPNLILEKDQIISQVWDEDSSTDANLKSRIFSLSNKVDPSHRYIHAIHGVGYILQEQMKVPDYQSAVKYEGFLFYPHLRLVVRNGQQISLRPSEFKLLKAFTINPNRVLTYPSLKETLGEISSKDSVRDTVKRLRHKIGDEHPHPTHIVNERGVGYKFET